MLGLAALPLVACKAEHGSSAPGLDVHDWTLAEIEAELDRNDHVLTDEGIMIALASPAGSPVEPAPVPPLDGPELEAQPEASDDDGGAAGEPEPEPSRPEPTLASEPEEQYVSEADDSTTRRDRSERRSAGRSANREHREPSRCERVCQLAAATCELETQICELAERHPDEPRYARACQRAEQQCLAASQACQRCED